MNAVIRVFLGAVLFVAILGKLASPEGFIAFLENAFHMSGSYGKTAFVLTVVTESIVGVLLVAARNRKWIGYVAALWFGLFAVVIGFAFLTGVSEACGCFGNLIEDAALDSRVVLRYGVLCALALLIAKRSTSGSD